MKATDLRAKTADQLKDELGDLQQGSSSTCASRRPTGQLEKHGARAPGAPRHRPHQDGAGRASAAGV